MRLQAEVKATTAGDKPLIGLLVGVTEVPDTQNPHYMPEVAHYPQLTEVHRLMP